MLGLSIFIVIIAVLVFLFRLKRRREVEAFKDANFAPDETWFPIDTFMDKPIDFKVLLRHLDKLLKKQ